MTSTFKTACIYEKSASLVLQHKQANMRTKLKYYNTNKPKQDKMVIKLK